MKFNIKASFYVNLNKKRYFLVCKAFFLETRINDSTLIKFVKIYIFRISAVGFEFY